MGAGERGERKGVRGCGGMRDRGKNDSILVEDDRSTRLSKTGVCTHLEKSGEMTLSRGNSPTF